MMFTSQQNKVQVSIQSLINHKNILKKLLVNYIIDNWFLIYFTVDPLKSGVFDSVPFPRSFLDFLNDERITKSLESIGNFCKDKHHEVAARISQELSEKPFLSSSTINNKMLPMLPAAHQHFYSNNVLPGIQSILQYRAQQKYSTPATTMTTNTNTFGDNTSNFIHNSPFNHLLKGLSDNRFHHHQQSPSLQVSVNSGGIKDLNQSFDNGKDRQYPCKICSKTFKRSSTLSTHMMIPVSYTHLTLPTKA